MSTKSKSNAKVFTEFVYVLIRKVRSIGMYILGSGLSLENYVRTSHGGLTVIQILNAFITGIKLGEKTKWQRSMAVRVECLVVYMVARALW